MRRRLEQARRSQVGIVAVMCGSLRSGDELARACGGLGS